ncbi:MAG: competence/damage-inducible protein A [Verrucomicrobia bacterium]|nr:competence/damage-inducible protein A [Verrucomicrobiota bacterium]
MNSSAVLEVINTGTELLFGSVVNTHLAYLGQQLFSIGLRVQRQVTVPDGTLIRDAIVEACERSNILIVTGGLGPTSDDITREIVAELTGRELVYHEEIFAPIRERFERRGIRMTDRIKRQAYVPKGATVLVNHFGTAPGLYLSADGKFPHLFLLPGPPREMCPMFEQSVLPILRGLIGKVDLSAAIFRIVGLGESGIEELISSDLDKIPGLELGYCARLGEVDVRVIGDHASVEQASEIVRNHLGVYVISQDSQSLEEVVVQELAAANATVATAESCTGGLLANRLTNVPGASAVFLEGCVTYSNEAKTRTLGVPAELISRVGAVSAEVAQAMAEGVRIRAGATYGLATTGIAGPDGGTAEKPVGTVFVALATPTDTQVEKLFYPSDRESFKQSVTQHLLDDLRLLISSPRSEVRIQ